MRVDYLEFPKPGAVELKQTEIDENVGPDEIVIHTSFTLVSPGREISAFDLQQDRQNEGTRYPFRPGTAAVGKISHVGTNVKHFAVGDTVLSTAPHASNVKLNIRKQMAFKLPEDIHPEDALFLILGILSIVPVRVATTEVGRKVAVLGLSLTGNITAQLFHTAGLDVTGIDIVEKRIQEAVAAGIPHTINAVQEDLQVKTDYLTDKRGFDIVVCAASNNDVLETCLKLVKDRGELVLMTSLDGPATVDASDHIYRRCVTIKGAHANYFSRRSESDFGWDVSKHLQLLITQLQQGKLKLRSLITHRLKPAEAQVAYKGVINKKEQFLGVVFEWN